jgi:maltooligosyltrehalose trehalohydrolase
VREGRRREFARFSSFSDEKRRAQIPDPNDARTFAASSPPETTTAPARDDEAKDRLDWMHFYKSALTVRAKLITPRLKHGKALDATVLTDENGADANALIARWKLGDGETLSFALNLSKQSVPFNDVPAGKVIFETPPRVREQIDANVLPPNAFVAWLTGDINDYASGHDARVVGKEERRT